MESNYLTSEKISVHTFSDSKVLDFSVTLWFCVATLGQWLFAAYVISFYGAATATGDLERWNKVLPHGYVAGDIVGNLVVGMHLFVAAIIIIGGPLQLIPQVRKYAKNFHRWNGRIYLFTAMLAALSGLIMVWTRGAVGDIVQHVSISINALFIITFGFLSLKYALAHNFELHRRWALRLYLVVNGVWFFRIGLMFWLLLHQAPVGFDPETFTGPFLTFLSTIAYVIPLPIVLLELYLRAKESANRTFRLFTSGVLFVFTLITALGVFAATMGMWLPRM